ncbi:MAG TPA: 50S ribosomal protein L9 [Sandaracinaceae bacterium LLY-WYZ-13_1]|nr:50S ribosomal protein L9 [Sandaracinaceae bacterium LLY-WYZ-13_1]
MAKHSVNVVLRDDVENLGRSGELVSVKPGYARNYLIPRGLAAIATHGNVKQIEHEKEMAIKRAAKQRAGAEKQAAELSAVSVEIEAQAGDTGKLFGSVGSKDIAEALAAKGVEVDRKKLLLDEPIKELGEHEVKLKLGYEVNATITVNVVAAE